MHQNPLISSSSCLKIFLFFAAGGCSRQAGVHGDFQVCQLSAIRIEWIVAQLRGENVSYLFLDTFTCSFSYFQTLVVLSCFWTLFVFSCFGHFLFSPVSKHFSFSPVSRHFSSQCAQKHLWNKNLHIYTHRTALLDVQIYITLYNYMIIII